ncbi:MAG: hypothetical protein IPI32_06970 [Austwickia sp.]|mgnify:CR=1 FL=1|jgi:hypothetical protein|nr:hypothetical protein [Austwickia sp.]MBK8437210.1 hypothetical protein [Austwickia sp.]MBK9102441.1 hypothetical protein [Austwickia sp.]
MSEPVHAADEAFATGLREAIAARGLSLERLRAHLAQRGHRVSVATLSYWQTARSRPDRAASLAALASLEEILGVDHGALSSLLPPRRRRSPSFIPTTLPSRAGIGYGEALDEAVGRMGLTWTDSWSRISVHDIIELDEHGFARCMRAREVIQAQHSTVTRIPIWALRDDATAQYRIEGRRNCTVTNVVPIDGEPVAVVELTLNRPLPPGQAMSVDYQMDLSGGQAPMTQHLRSARTAVRELHLELRFAPGRMPRSAVQFVVVGEKRRTTPLLLKGPTLDVRHSDFGPGVAGIEWVW